MTDQFLESQTLGVGDTREERCELFEKQHQKPQYSEDDVKISDIRFAGTKATAVIGSDIANVTSKYTLLHQGGRWRIDSADIQ